MANAGAKKWVASLSLYFDLTSRMVMCCFLVGGLLLTEDQLCGCAQEGELCFC